MHRRVKCWAFAPPGGLADPHVAEAAQEFCTSVVLGKDWIPRLTVHSFERLRDEMVRTWSALLHDLMCVCVCVCVCVPCELCLYCESNACNKK